MDHNVKFKENKIRANDLDLTRELRKPWNMKMTVISIVISSLGTMPKGMEKRLEELVIKGRIETLQTTALLSQNTERSSGDVKRLAVPQSLVKDH